MPTEHPGEANYPAAGARRGSRGDQPRTGTSRNAYLPPPTHNPHLPPLDEHDEYQDHAGPNARTDPTGPRIPKKITVARVAAMRSRELTGKGIEKIHRAATADGADRSGMTALTLPVITNFAVDAAMAVGLANTLFFAAATAESKSNVALYLLLTIAPFAFIAPLIGPLLDRLQTGRRIAMASTFALRVVLALLIIANSSWDGEQLVYDPWVLYPCALGLLVLSKSFGVLKSAVTPRVVPPSIDLPRVNSRLTTFGLIAGTIVGGAIAAFFELMLVQVLPIHVPGAMLWLSVVAAAGAYFCMRIPKWVEVTEGEVPTTITYHAQSTGAADSATARAKNGAKALAATMRQPLGRNVVTGLWGNGTIRILTGFLTLYIAFYAKAQQDVQSDWMQLVLLGSVGAAAGVGNMLGNGIGTRVELRNPPLLVVSATASCFVVAVLAAIFGNVLIATLAAFIASGTSAIGKVCLDSSIQNDLPERSRASAFGRSETVLQLSWVFGASLGVLLPTTLWIGFTVVAVLLGLGLVQTVLTKRGTSLVPGLGGRRPENTAPTSPYDQDQFTHLTYRTGEMSRPAPGSAATSHGQDRAPAAAAGPSAAPTRAEHRPGGSRQKPSAQPTRETPAQPGRQTPTQRPTPPPPSSRGGDNYHR